MKNDQSGHFDIFYIHLRVFRADLSKKKKIDPIKANYPLNSVHDVKLKAFRGQRGIQIYI